MNRMILLGLIVAVAMFVCSCATYSSFYGPRKIMPSEVTEVLVIFEEHLIILLFATTSFSSLKLLSLCVKC